MTIPCVNGKPVRLYLSASLVCKSCQTVSSCLHVAVTSAAVFRPVSQTLNISKIANVKQYFPNLAEVTMLDENEVLPFMHEVYRAKIVWTVVYNGVVGEVRLGGAWVSRVEPLAWTIFSPAHLLLQQAFLC